jgi:hypothetical protein
MVTEVLPRAVSHLQRNIKLLLMRRRRRMTRVKDLPAAEYVKDRSSTT